MPETLPAQGGAPANGVTIITGNGGPSATPPGKVGEAQTNAFVLRLIGRYGTAENALTHLAGEQLRYRTRAQTAEASLVELQKQLPTAGSVVLTGDAAKAFAALNADGKLDLSTVGAQLKELAELRSTRGKESRQAALTLAAGDKYKVKVLQKVLGETPLEFKKVLQRKEDGEEGMEEVSLPYVKVGDTLEPLDAWLEREHEDFMDIIMVEDRDDSADEDKPSKKPKDKEEIPASRMPRQTPSGGGDRSSGGKKGDKDIMKQVDKTLSIHMTPAQRRKADAAASV